MWAALSPETRWVVLIAVTGHLTRLQILTTRTNNDDSLRHGGGCIRVLDEWMVWSSTDEVTKARRNSKRKKEERGED